MFGRPIYDFAMGDEASLRTVALRKRRVIEGYSGATAYVETSHAFLKSWANLAVEFFPRMKLVQLVRNPLAVAKSEAVREALVHRWRLPLRNYRGPDGKLYFRWSLTGREPIFSHFEDRPISRLQWYLVQWIEIENRAMRFLEQYSKASDCFTLHSPQELNEPAKLEGLLDFLHVDRPPHGLTLQGRKNRTPGVTATMNPQDDQELTEVVDALPPSYLAIFGRPPYTQWQWSARLARSGSPSATS